MNIERTAERRSLLLGPVLTYGFGTAVGVWTVWYVTHVPWLNLAEQGALPVILAAWLIGAIAAGKAGGWPVGLGAGLVTAVLGLLVLGSKLTQPTGTEGADLKPSAVLMAAGFIGLGGVVGLVGGIVGGMLARGRPPRDVDWLSRFAIVAAVAVAPLLFIGGMVTSTNSGMAVPDWPNTFGSNMFLYPLGPRAAPEVFFEHAHRLFGSLVGLTTLVLMVWVLVTRQPRWVKIVAAAAFLLVVVQGILGGGRVLFGSAEAARDSRLLATIHGVLAQLTFGIIVASAVFLSPTFKAAGAVVGPGTGVPGGRLRLFTTGLLHTTILQLIFGAMYRHFRNDHSLWTHAGFSVVVLVLALLAGFAAASLAADYGGIGRIIRRCGTLVIVVVSLQFALGWATFAVGGRGLQADAPAQALLRTAHQANGGLLLAAATLAFLWTRRLLRLASGG